MSKSLPLFPEQASTTARDVDALFFALLGMSAFFSVLIAGSILYFAIRYRRGRMPLPGRPVPPLWIEIVWTAGPLVLSLAFFAWGAATYFHIQRAPAQGMEISVIAKQWMWKFQHPDGHREINELHIPVGQPVKLTMISEDVIHSLYVPAFRVKQDVLPARYTTLWFEATRPGQFHLFCAEYCGTKHSAMGGRVVALEPAQYQLWLAGKLAAEPVVDQGRWAFQKLRCDSCHSEEGSRRGPLLAGRFGQSVPLTGGGTATFDAAYVRESILRPQAKVVAGSAAIMPTYEGQISEEEIVAIIDYLKQS
jgi:cytochrome c oxidase subunit 2